MVLWPETERFAELLTSRSNFRYIFIPQDSDRKATGKSQKAEAKPRSDAAIALWCPCRQNQNKASQNYRCWWCLVIHCPIWCQQKASAPSVRVWAEFLTYPYLSCARKTRIHLHSLSRKVAQRSDKSQRIAANGPPDLAEKGETLDSRSSRRNCYELVPCWTY